MTGVAGVIATARARLVSLSSQLVEDTVLDPADASVTYEVNSDGTVTPPVTQNWWRAGVTPGIGSGYEVRATLQSGTTPSGTLGSWLALSSSRAWTLTRTSQGTNTAELLVEIRATSGTVLASAVITLQATVDI